MLSYKVIYEKRKSINIFFDGRYIKVKAPIRTSKKYINILVEKFYIKNKDIIKVIESQHINNEILVLGEHASIEHLGILDSNYNTIKKYFIDNHKKDMVNYLNILANKYEFKYSTVSFKKLKCRWGSCNSKKQLVFNNLIFMLPINLIEYLIIHELCHLRHLNHGKLFWTEVGDILPNYKELQTKLKSFGYLTSIYK